MANRILNIVVTGGWQSVAIPQRARFVSIQNQANAVMSYRWAGQSETWTIKAGDTRNLFSDQLWPTDLEVMATVGNVIEIEVSAANNGQFS
jgi:hypothetical protein